jgi:GNAT superfamily N-acetyltransferase
VDGESNGLTIRTLRAGDVARLVRMDEQITRRHRQAWYESSIKRALAESDLKISLGAESNGILVGAVLGSLQYGEFGVPEPVAVIDTILVDRGFRHRRVATEILEQLVKNLGALGIERLRTEIAWNEHELAGFLGKNGFAPAPRLVLERELRRDG